MNITKEEFERYESVKKSGVTNMNLINSVCDLSDLERDKVLYIMKNYADLINRYSGENHENNNANTN